ncbi:MAG TPA: hypothetical protein VGM54_07050 [Chthoniobacter sp.]
MNGRPSLAEKFRAFARRHPLLVDSLLWAVPALIFGGLLRILLTSYLPYAFWGADSRSFYTFAHKFLNHGALSLGDKRRYLYPLLMLPVSYLPGGPLRWLPFFQHAFGWITLAPLAYVVRKTLVLWRLWIVPVTVIYAGLPVIVWREHELDGDTLFFALLVWTFAGWMAWVTQSDSGRARRLFWWFLVPFALFIATKPSGRFVWPGLLLALLFVKSWRVFRWPQWVALFAVLAITPTVGSKKQGAWLFYDATFPLTSLDTPLHADYKAEIRDLVLRYRQGLDVYHATQRKEPFFFLRDPGDQDQRPLWKALGKDERLKNKIYLDLALEAVKTRPDLFLYLGLQRVAFDANVSAYETFRFDDGSFIESSTQFYQEAQESEESPLRIAYDLPRKGPVPDYATFQKKLEPAPNSWAARAVRACENAYGKKLDFLRYPPGPESLYRLSHVRLTFLGGWLCLALLLVWLPRYSRTLGVWAIITLGYVFGVYLISVENVRYIAPIWPVCFVLLAVPADFFLAMIFARREGAKSSLA